MREFLTFFLKKKEEIISKIEDLHSVTCTATTLNAGEVLNRSFEQKPVNPEMPFAFHLIPDFGVGGTDRNHSDNEMKTNTQIRLANLMYLRIMCEIFLFHALVILITTGSGAGDEGQQDTPSGEAIVLRNELTTLIKSDNALPLDFCREVLFTHDLHEEALTMLLHKKDYTELLSVLRTEVDRAMRDAKANPSCVPVRQYWIRKLVRYARKINGKPMTKLM